MNRRELIEALRQYATDDVTEKSFVPRFLELLGEPRAYHRDHLPGHMTGSAWIVDETGEFVLLTHHAKLDKWLQPGGHADGEEEIFNVGIREAREETGLQTLTVLSTNIFDIDIHLIPARGDFPAHNHYDIRVLLQGRRDEPLLISEESHDLAWVHINELAKRTKGNTSMLRMALKGKAFLKGERPSR
jgi:8-oxo-dGTP pyrophosphatase MutT (NUDIX family)